MEKRDKVNKIRLIFIFMAIALVVVSGLSFHLGHKIGVKRAYRDFVAYEEECKTANKVLDVYIEGGMYKVRCVDPWMEAVGFA